MTGIRGAFHIITVVPPTAPKVYHIVHVDRLPSIIADGQLWCDLEMVQRNQVGTSIGMPSIKEIRLKNMVGSHHGLYVGGCVPFYFCPRSIMLYVVHKANASGLTYRGGQEAIVHLEADLHGAVVWADGQNRRWAFTTSNAGSSYFDDYADLANLDEIDWDAVRAHWWAGDGVDETVRHSKQAEFLVEWSFPWGLIGRIGVYSRSIRDRVMEATSASSHCPPVQIQRTWYY